MVAMQKLHAKGLVLVFAGAALALTVQPTLAAEEVSELVSASAEELSDRQVQAQVLAAALEQAIAAGAAAEAEDTAADNTSSAQQARSTLRSEVLREGEDSVSEVPALPKTSPEAMERFQALRDRFTQAQDVSLLMPELAVFIQQYPGHREARITMGRLQILNQRSAAALEVLAPLLVPLAADSHPDWQPWFWAGTAYLATDNVEKAREMLDIAVTKDSTISDIWIQLAVIEQEQNNHAGALQYLAIAEQLEPELAAIYLNRAYSLEQLQRYEEALNAYQRFLVSDTSTGGASMRPAVLRRITTIASAVKQTELQQRG